MAPMRALPLLLLASLPAGAWAGALACPHGQVRTEATEGHCCWLQQTWDEDRCAGPPVCPGGWFTEGERCVGTEVPMEDVTLTVMRNRDVKECIAAAYRATEKPVLVEVRFHIDPAGTVHDVRATSESHPDDASLAPCLASAFEGLRFEETRGEGTDVTYPMEGKDVSDHVHPDAD